jgi:DNA (cytosine-5)-methyltransferase 1
MTHGSLFSGIGGFDLAAQWMGWENVFHCEWNEFGQKILKYYWPNAISYHDITKTDFTIHRGAIDILTGGFPCQPYSTAGKRKGKDDERHLWPEMLRAIREIRPTYIVGENVFGLLNWNGGLVFNEVQTDLETEGYEVFAYVLPACAVNAPHRRDRIWFVAYCPNKEQRESAVGGIRAKSGNSNRIAPNTDKCAKRPSGKSGEPAEIGGGDNDEQKERGEQTEQHIRCSDVLWDIANTKNIRQEQSRSTRKRGAGFKNGSFGDDVTDANSRDNQTRTHGEILGQQNRKKANGYLNVERPNQWQNFPTQSPVCSRNDGLPTELDGITFSKWRNESIKAAGNAIVPQVAYEIFKAIQSTI